jgi:hypothetical protein
MENKTGKGFIVWVEYSSGYKVGLSPSMVLGRMMALKLRQEEAIAVREDTGEKVGATWNDGNQWNYYVDMELVGDKT